MILSSFYLFTDCAELKSESLQCVSAPVMSINLSDTSALPAVEVCLAERDSPYTYLEQKRSVDAHFLLGPSKSIFHEQHR